MKKLIITLSLVLVALMYSWASHVAGGHISYTLTGSNNGINTYTITLTFYRFCGDGASPANNFENLVVSGCGLNNVTVDNPVTTPFENNCANDCFEEIVYTGTMDIPVGCNDVTISWTEEERNPSIFYQTQDLFIESTIYPRQDNSSVVPDINTLTACLGEEFVLDMNTLFSEPDGDLVVFTLTPPRFTANNNLPFTGGVTWDEPLQTENGVDMTDGVLSFTPTLPLGNTVFSVYVQEFVGGTLVAESYVDFTVLISTCQNVPPTLSNLPAGPVTACIGQETTITLNYSDFEDQTVYINDNWHTPRGSVIVDGNTITITFTPDWWDEVHHSSFIITLRDEVCVGFPATTTAEIVFDVVACDPDDGLEFCGHQCMPQLPPPIVTLGNADVVTITNDCQENGNSNGHPAYWIIENAIGYTITVWGQGEMPPPIDENWQVYDPWYHCEEVNINGLHHEWVSDLDPTLSYPYRVNWDGIDDNNTIVPAGGYLVRIRAWNCVDEVTNIDEPYFIVHDGACTQSGVPLLPFDCPPKVFEFDDGCVQEIQCPPVLNVTQPQSGVFVDNSVYRAADLITAVNYHLVTPSDVELIAGNKVVINPGVTVENGAKLVARIESCEDGFGKRDESTESEQNPYRDFMNGNSAIEENTINVYPNPNNGSFTIEGDDVTRVEFYDVLGALVDTKQAEGNRLIMEGLVEGVYLLLVYDSTDEFTVRKVVVF